MKSRRTLKRSPRKARGGALVLAISLVFVLVLVGGGFFELQKILGGGRELQNATDSGNLNIAKNFLIHPTVRLQGNEERLYFSQLLTESNGEISLRNINKIIGYATLVAMNEREIMHLDDTYKFNGKNLYTPGQGQMFLDRATIDPGDLENAKTDATRVVNACNSICTRLKNAIVQDNADAVKFFNEVAKQNSLRMLGDPKDAQLTQRKFDTAYVDDGSDVNLGLSNVALDFAYLPIQDEFTPASANNSQLKADTANDNNDPSSPKQNLIKGYKPLPTFEGGPALAAVPVQPYRQPHLTSFRKFEAKKAAPNDFVPPNAFRSFSNTKESHGYNVDTNSCALIGCLSGTSTASIPNGFIRIINVSGAAALGESNLTAIEWYKAKVVEAYRQSHWSFGGDMKPRTVDSRELVTPDFPEPPANGYTSNATGVRLYNHGSTYLYKNGNKAKFGTPGTVWQLLLHVAGNEPGVSAQSKLAPIVSRLVQRLKQICPGQPDSFYLSALQGGPTIDLGQEAYLYLAQGGQNPQFKIVKAGDTSMPTWLKQQTNLHPRSWGAYILMTSKPTGLLNPSNSAFATDDVVNPNSELPGLSTKMWLVTKELAGGGSTWQWPTVGGGTTTPIAVEATYFIESPGRYGDLGDLTFVCYSDGVAKFSIPLPPPPPPGT